MAPIPQPQFVGQMVPIDMLFPSPMNPRKKFTDASLVDLTANIQKVGRVIVPLVLRPNGKKFEIIDGERRYRASKAAGSITQLPAIVLEDLADSDAIEMMLLTSIQKQELTPLEEAGGFRALLDSNKSKYSAAYIAERIGRSEKYVWDRMKLLDLIPILKKLLDADRIHVGHGEILARLKPEDQERALDEPDHRGAAGLWERESDRLRLDDEDVEEPSAKNLYRGLKPVSVKELESWVAHHVRFDPEHMAKAAPLEFGQVAKDVEHAAALPGRGKKVISITNEYRVDDDAKDPNERTYGQQSWVRADGKEKSKTCEHSVLGVFVAGPGYGTTQQVCINRDKCAVHFGTVIKAREKNQKLRQQGKGGKAAQREVAQQQKDERERQAREAAEKRWDAARPKVKKAILDHVDGMAPKQLVPIVARKYAAGAKTAEAIVKSIAMKMAITRDWYLDGLHSDAAPFGFDVKKWVADFAKEAAAPTKTTKKAKKR